MFQSLHGPPESASTFQGSETPADCFCKTAGMSRQNSSQSKADIRNPLRYLLMNAVASRSAFK